MSFVARDLLLQVIGDHRPELLEHTDQVAALAAATARSLGLAGDVVQQIAQAAELHDIGKVAIPHSVLSKPEPLSQDEWTVMRQHTVIGERMLSEAPELRPVAALVRSSHERWDGAGYPDGLAGEQIPLAARIVSACDAFNAMTTDRSYRKALTAGVAVAELRANSGTQFDPKVVEALVSLVDG